MKTEGDSNQLELSNDKHDALLQHLASFGKTSLLPAHASLACAGAISDLSEALKSTSARVRVSAALALGRTQHPDAVPLLLRCLRTYGELETKRAAASSLVTLPSQRDKPEILVLCLVATEEWEILRGIGPPAIPYLCNLARDYYYGVFGVWGALDALGEMRDETSVQLLTKALETDIGDHGLKGVQALVKIGEPAVPSLITAAGKPNRFSFSYVSRALAEIGDIRAVPVLIAALRYRHSFDRRSAADALGELGDERAFEPLLSLLLMRPPYDFGKRDRDLLEGDRCAAICALKKINAQRAVPCLVDATLWDATRHGSPSGVRRVAALVLGEIGDEAAIPFLVKMLDRVRYIGSNDPWLKHDTAIALEALRKVFSCNDRIGAFYLRPIRQFFSLMPDIIKQSTPHNVGLAFSVELAASSVLARIGDATDIPVLKAITGVFCNRPRTNRKAAREAIRRIRESTKVQRHPKAKIWRHWR